MSRLTIALFIFGVFLTSGCASVQVQEKNVYPNTDPNKSLVYFFREKRLVGFAISYNIRHNGDVIGAVGNGTYFYKFIQPGSHTFTASVESDVERTLNMEVGETYYISCGVTIGLLAGRPTMAIVNEQEANSVLPQLRYAVKPVDESASNQ